MSFIDSGRAGKRVCCFINGKNECTRVVPVPAQENQRSYHALTVGGEVMPAGIAMQKGYLTYAELKIMFPLHKQAHVVTKTTYTQSKQRARTAERTFITRWGLYALTDSGKKTHLPRWIPLGDKGKVKDHTKDYLKVEERKTTFKVVIEDERETLVTCVGQECVVYRAGKYHG